MTVAVTPSNAAKLLEAQVAGRLCLTLRSEKDRTPLPVSDLVKVEPPAVRIPAPPVAAAIPLPAQHLVPIEHATPQIDVWSGSRKDVVSFKKEGELGNQAL